MGSSFFLALLLSLHAFSWDNCKIALTFDDGPKNPTTFKIMDSLNRAKAPATFFWPGKMLFNNAGKGNLSNTGKKALNAVVNANGRFLLGDHSVTHKMSGSRIAQEMGKTTDRLEDVSIDGSSVADYLTPFHRAPGGTCGYRYKPVSYCKKIYNDRNERGAINVQWDGVGNGKGDPVFPGARRVSPRELVGRFCKNGGGVLLMHDLNKRSAKWVEEFLALVKKRPNVSVSPLAEVLLEGRGASTPKTKYVGAQREEVDQWLQAFQNLQDIYNDPGGDFYPAEQGPPSDSGYSFHLGGKQ